MALIGIPRFGDVVRLMSGGQLGLVVDVASCHCVVVAWLGPDKRPQEATVSWNDIQVIRRGNATLSKRRSW